MHCTTECHIPEKHDGFSHYHSDPAKSSLMYFTHQKLLCRISCNKYLEAAKCGQMMYLRDKSHKF